MRLPPRTFFCLIEVASRWGCSNADIVDWSAAGRIEIVASIQPTRFGAEILSGIVVISAADIIPMFRRDGSGPNSCQVRRAMQPGQTETGWQYLALGELAPVITRADILITTTEICRFEEAHGLSKRVAVQSPNLKYDWDEFYQAMIVHIHERGLPATQADLARAS
ncbi:MAG: hypothetical protein Q4G24_16470 [Paracoccus sp. (in: a-proteobacteria)]|uniref:hypothetical protein n=1 Tax=Paracoccus sp. TaxID=267 RepID=UPI0026DFCA88|nr:hypothetical protein [Paracoccus sp. (in: a-proteobacteria)]MDO5623033.1 hypothetical protein [Paracoccus sp. (in: a-proteobacteria)]